MLTNEQDLPAWKSIDDLVTMVSVDNEGATLYLL